jgi:hypothetical protein
MEIKHMIWNNQWTNESFCLEANEHGNTVYQIYDYNKDNAREDYLEKKKRKTSNDSECIS